MGTMRVTSYRGDITYRWDREQATTGDPEALAAVREAERIFAEQVARGATAFRVDVGAPARRLERFDPEATSIVTIPIVAGG